MSTDLNRSEKAVKVTQLKLDNYRQLYNLSEKDFLEKLREVKTRTGRQQFSDKFIQEWYKRKAFIEVKSYITKKGVKVSGYKKKYAQWSKSELEFLTKNIDKSTDFLFKNFPTTRTRDQIETRKSRLIRAGTREVSLRLRKAEITESIEKLRKEKKDIERRLRELEKKK